MILKSILALMQGEKRIAGTLAIEDPPVFKLESQTEMDQESNANRLSPGPELLHKWMDSQRKDKDSLASLAMYNVLPAFPTSFIVACNTEIEVRMVQS